MTDIVTRLRDWLDEDTPIGVIMNEAADEIERLRTLLKAIRNFPNLSAHYGTLTVAEIDAALKEDSNANKA